MSVYENDMLVIPEKYKKMSVSDLEKEKANILKKINMSERQKKPVKKNTKNIIFHF